MRYVPDCCYCKCNMYLSTAFNNLVKLLKTHKLHIVWCIFIVIISRNFIAYYNYPVLGDEAETVLLADSVVDTGLPKLNYSGHPFSNLLGYDIGSFGADIHHSWLQYYFTSANIILFKTLNIPLNDYKNLRIGYYLLTVFSFWLLYKTLTRSFPQRVIVLLISGVVYLNGSYLTYLFTIRYYVFLVISLILLIYSGSSFINKKRRIGEGLFALFFSQLFLYFSHWYYFVSFLPLIIIYSYYSITDKNKFLALWLCLLMLILPHFVVYYPISNFLSLHTRVSRIIDVNNIRILIDISTQFLPGFLVVLVLSLINTFRSLKHKSDGVSFNLFIGGLTILTLLANTQALVNPRIRYYLFIFPLYFMLVINLLKPVVNKPEYKTLLITFLCVFSLYISITTSTLKWSANEKDLALIWAKNNIKSSDLVYVNFDKRDILLHTSATVVSAYDFKALEESHSHISYNKEQDPTYKPIESVHWIYWDSCADSNARDKEIWLNSNYVSLKSVPYFFEIKYSNGCINIYEHSV